MTNNAVTLYHHPELNQLHVLISEVEENSGKHKVIRSEIVDLSLLTFGAPSFSLHTEIEWYQYRFGPDKVRAYVCTEAS